jgi:chromosome segregation ATPase
MNLVTMLPVVLPIFLFVVTLIIIFGLRANDKNKRGLQNVSTLLEKYKGYIEDSNDSFKHFAAELEQTVAKKNDEVQALIHKVDTQIAELKEYSEDLVKLKNAMDTYKTALEGLAKLTEDADDKVSSVQTEANRLDNVRNVIDGFRQDMKDADEHLRKHEQRVIQLERESVTRMNEAVSETDNSMDEAMASLHKESQEVLTSFREMTSKDTDQRLKKIDDAFQAVIHTVQQFYGELQHKLDTVNQEAERLSSLLEKSSELGAVVTETFSPKDKRESVSYPVITHRVEEVVVETASSQPEVEPEPELSQVEITDIDYDLNQNSGNKYDDFEDPQEPEKQWETYGEEEVVDFDDEQ